MKRFLFLLIFSAFCLATVRAQEADRISMSNVDQSAEFPGGRKAMLKFFAENVVYPEEALKQDIQGCVRISATIDKDGSVKNVEVVESVHPLLDAEAVRVVKQMPKWNPEMMDGKPMSVCQTIPVTFKIPNPVNFGVNEHTVNDLDSKPEFPGGIEASKKYIAENLIYPEEAKRQGICGRVLVVTGIDRDGTVKVLGIEKSVHPLLDEEAKRVISSMPKWKPGIKDGKPMRLKTTIPVNFGVAEHSIDDLDSKPEFPGGIEASKKYIAENLIYPEEAKRQGIRGRVLVVTGIDRDGTVKVLGIEKSVHPLLDEEAKRVISSMPKWKPGIKDGKPMRLKTTIPVNFGVAEHTVNDLDSKPEFPGGIEASKKYIAENLIYPEEAKRQGIRGRVLVVTGIDRDGTVKVLGIEKSVHPLLDEEAKRVISSMPKWKPGIKDGKPMRLKTTIPVNFGVAEHTVNDLDSKPEFPGGIEASKKYIAENLIYPEEAKRQGIRGRVLVVTGIDRDGTVKVLGIEKSVHPLLDEEAKRVISSMPKWKPGIKDGKPVRLKTTIPVNFGVAEHSIDELDRKPEFPGGIEASKKYIAENLIYPEKAKRQGICGRVLVVTGIDRDGTVKVLGIEKSVHPLLDEEAKRVISSMPKWKPGIKDGKPMRLKITIPVNFDVAEHSIDELDRKPEFPGGLDVCIKYLAVNVKYPKEAAKRKIQGRVIVDFVVNRDGSITDANVVKSVHYLLDEEALRVVKTMPKWNPGILDGKPVRVKYSLPITFRIPESLSAR